MSDHSEQALNGQTAVVTGAGRGIGAAIAVKLAGLGAHGRTLWAQPQASGNDGGNDFRGGWTRCRPGM